MAEKLMVNIVVYTCITNQYDWLLPPMVTPGNIRYVCFSDTAIPKSQGWTVLPIPRDLAHLPPNMVNRHLKLFPHRYLHDHQWSVYLDGNLRLLKDPTALVQTMASQGKAMGCPAHPDRQDIYQEAQACSRYGKFTAAEAQLIEAQISCYKTSGMPARQRLTENNFIIRKHTDPAVQEAMAAWWEQLQGFTQRDQISLPYVIWKTQLSLYYFDFAGSVANDFIKKVPHRKTGLPGFRDYVAARQVENRCWRMLHLALRLVAISGRPFTRVKNKYLLQKKIG